VRVSTAALPEPLRRFTTQIDDLRSSDVPDMELVGRSGHVPGSGPTPYSLILLGDDMLLFDREEYDPGRGTWRALPPGDPGRSNR
jgi:hypothetical protein